jgi:hypothetical protein
VRDDWPNDFEDQFKALYPNKVGMAAGLRVLRSVRQSGTVTWGKLTEGLRRYAAKTDNRQWCNPAKWLSEERWDDEPGPDVGAGFVITQAVRALRKQAEAMREQAQPHVVLNSRDHPEQWAAWRAHKAARGEPVALIDEKARGGGAITVECDWPPGHPLADARYGYVVHRDHHRGHWGAWHIHKTEAGESTALMDQLGYVTVPSQWPPGWDTDEIRAALSEINATADRFGAEGRPDTSRDDPAAPASPASAAAAQSSAPVVDVTPALAAAPDAAPAAAARQATARRPKARPKGPPPPRRADPKQGAVEMQLVDVLARAGGLGTLAAGLDCLFDLGVDRAKILCDRFRVGGLPPDEIATIATEFRLKGMGAADHKHAAAAEYSRFAK